jgi:hypothetical protein
MAQVQLPPTQALPPVQALPHALQLAELVVRSTHAPLQLVVLPAQAGVHWAVPLEVEHKGVPPEQLVLHAPQCAAIVTSVSQPSLAFVVQCLYPAAHEAAGTTQAPAEQLTAPLTCASAAQSKPQLPQLWVSV